MGVEVGVEELAFAHAVVFEDAPQANAGFETGDKGAARIVGGGDGVEEGVYGVDGAADDVVIALEDCGFGFGLEVELIGEGEDAGFLEIGVGVEGLHEVVESGAGSAVIGTGEVLEDIEEEAIEGGVEGGVELGEGHDKMSAWVGGHAPR